MADDVDLADRDVEVLEMVVQHPESTVTRLREATHWAEKNQHIHYRLDKLSDDGYVETWTDPETETRGPLDPIRVSPTDEGEELMEIVGTDRPAGLEARVEELEKEADHWRPTYMRVRELVNEFRQTVEEQNRRIDRLEEDVERIKHLREQEREDEASLVDEFEFG